MTTQEVNVNPVTPVPPTPQQLPQRPDHVPNTEPPSDTLPSFLAGTLEPKLHPIEPKLLRDLKDRITDSLGTSQTGEVTLGQNNAKFAVTISESGEITLEDQASKEVVLITKDGQLKGTDQIVNSIIRSLARQDAEVEVTQATEEQKEAGIIQKALGALSKIAQGARSAYIRENSMGVEAKAAQDLLLLWLDKGGDQELQAKRDLLNAERERGIFGPESVRVLRAFQRSVGLDANGQLFSTDEEGKLGLRTDGILGIRTLNALAQWHMQSNTQVGLLAWGQKNVGDNSALLAAVQAEHDLGIFGEKSRELFNLYRKEKGLGEGSIDKDFVFDKATYEQLLKDWSNLGLGDKPQDPFSQYIYNLSWGNLDEFRRLTGDSWGGKFDGVQGLGDGADFVHNKLSPEAMQRVAQIAASMGARTEDLLAVMSFETGGTFSPSERNHLSGATGLIQFMPSTAKNLGTSVEALAQMSQVEQLDYVEKYFAPYQGRSQMSLEDLYMAVLWPAGVGKDNSFVLFSGGSIEYRQNSGLDVNGDGAVSKYEAAAKVREHLSYIERDIDRIVHNPSGTMKQGIDFTQEATNLAQDYNNRGVTYGSGAGNVNCVTFMTQFYENIGLTLSEEEERTVLISHWDNLSASERAEKYSAAVRSNSSTIFGAPKVLVDRGLADYAMLEDIKSGESAVIQYHWLNSKGEQRGHVGILKNVVKDESGNITGINLISANSPSLGIGSTFVPISELRDSYRIARLR